MIPYTTDIDLARRLERAEANGNAAFVESRARVSPDVGAAWIAVGGTYAMFDGVGSPSTQTFGLGVFAPVTADDLTTIESFFHERGSDVFHEVSPLADPAHLALLPARGYVPVELSTVLHQPILPRVNARPSPDIRVRRIAPGEEQMWAEGAARGWSDTPGLSEFILNFGRISAASRGNVCFVAESAGETIATAALALHGGVAVLAGASTVPQWRRRGAQAALLDVRLQYALEVGCDLAMMASTPGSGSQRNAERQGFRIAYTRCKWHRPRPE